MSSSGAADSTPVPTMRPRGEVVALPGADTAPLPGRISVVTVSYRTGPALMESIRSVLRDPDIFELIVVDNGNDLADRKRLGDMIAKHPRLRLVQGHGNTGFARGSNYGADLARGDFLLFLNPDAVIETGAARALVMAGQGRTRPWIAGGRLLSPAGEEQRGSRRGALTFASAFASFTPLHRLPGLRSLHREDEPLPNGPVEIPTISGAFLLMPRSSYETLQGFDPGYFLHVEDVALCRAARAAGGVVVFVPNARALHYGSTSHAPRLAVEWYKLVGFLRYFWTGAERGTRGSLPARLGTVLGAPLMAVAILGRAAWLSLRQGFLGR